VSTGIDDAEADALENASPDPLEHATPDAELADAQLALGRPELVPEPGGEDESESIDEFESEADDAADAAELEEALGAGGSAGSVVPPRRRRRSSADADGDDDFDGDLVPAPAPVPTARPHIGSRLINFIQGSWRELQRVQWPDRRQVMQATGVVLGFVVVAGVFLGVADAVAQRVVNLIITGHFK
jgi:preprotein translocase SecE subunit